MPPTTEAEEWPAGASTFGESPDVADWPFWVAFGSVAFWVNFALLSAIFRPADFGVLGTLAWVGFIGAGATAYYDVKQIQRETGVRFMAPTELAISFWIPVVNYIGAATYLYRRFKHLNSRPRDGRFSHPTLVVGGGLSAALAVTIVPVLFGPLGVLAGYWTRKWYDARQGTPLMIVAGLATVIGFGVNLYATLRI